MVEKESTPPQIHLETDFMLIERILMKQEARIAYGVLYDRFAHIIYKKCLFLVKDEVEAQDLTHDIFIKCMMKLSTFKGTASLKTWMLRIAYNHTIDWIKKHKKQTIEAIEDNELIGEIAIDETLLEREVKLTSLETAFDVLPFDYKTVLMMFYQDGLKIKEIAATLHLTEGSVKMRLKRAKSKLEELINAYESKE